MTTITIYARAKDGADIEHLTMVCFGITYEPSDVAKVNDLYRYTFRAVTIPDTQTPTFNVSVSDGLRLGERLG